MQEDLKPHYDPAWRASDAALECIKAVLEKYRPKTILEFGPGLSSFLFYSYQRLSPAVQYTAIDHQGPYATAHAGRVAALGFPCSGLKHVPLLPSGAYDLAGIALPHPDFVFLDGPPAGSARVAMAPLLASFNPCIWLIDDTHRANEYRLARSLVLPQHSFHLIHDLAFPPRTSMLICPRS